MFRVSHSSILCAKPVVCLLASNSGASTSLASKPRFAWRTRLWLTRLQNLGPWREAHVPSHAFCAPPPRLGQGQGEERAPALPPNWSLEGHLDDSWGGNPGLTMVSPWPPLTPTASPPPLDKHGGEVTFPIYLPVPLSTECVGSQGAGGTHRASAPLRNSLAAPCLTCLQGCLRAPPGSWVLPLRAPSRWVITASRSPKAS